MSNPRNFHAIDDVKFVTGYEVEVVVASRRDIEEALDRTDLEHPAGVLLGEALCDD